MARVDGAELKQVARKVVQNASRPGGAMDKGEFTLGIARKEISIRMGLGPKGLEEAEWKARVKELVHLAMDEVADEVSARASSPVKPQGHSSPPKKQSRTDNAGTSAPSRSKKRSKRESTSDEDSDEVEILEDEEEEDFESSPPRKQQKDKRRQSGTGRARAARDETSEEDEGIATNAEERPKKQSSSVKRKAGSGTQRTKKASPIEVSDDSDEERQKNDDKSESEMSSLYDVAPAPKRGKSTSKTRGSSDDVAVSEKRKRKDPDEGLSTDEALVADLKKIVTACGVRKIWSKEFADDPSPREQRHRIEVMLRELGMKGKPTIGKARALKEKRELAAELNDVQQFEAARGLSSSRTSRSKAKTARQRDPDSDDEEEEQASDEPQGAFGAIMDFLGDDVPSDSD